MTLNEVVMEALKPGLAEQSAAAAFASAALRALAEAGFVIVPREGLMQAAQRAEQAMRAWYEYQYNNKGTFDGKSERHDLVNAWRSLAAALKEMGAG